MALFGLHKMVYRELPGELPALQRAVARLHSLAARRRALLATAPAHRAEDFDTQLMRCEHEQHALEGAEERFDDAFATSAERVLRAGGAPATRLDALLIEVPMLAGRVRAAKVILEGLRASYASLGATASSRSNVAEQLALSGMFAEHAALDPEVVRGIDRARALLALGTRENTRRHDLGLSVELRRLVSAVAEVVQMLNRKSRGAGRALFELVAFA